jgi:hemerythrin
VEQIGRQHRQLVNFVDKLHQAMLAGSQPQQLAAVMNELILYTKYHFAREEQLMAETAYPGRHAHALKHQALKAKVAEYADQILGGRVTTSMNVMRFLKDWLSKHILGADKDFAESLKSRRRAA